jgi:hypothetical protein
MINAGNRDQLAARVLTFAGVDHQPHPADGVGRAGL